MSSTAGSRKHPSAASGSAAHHWKKYFPLKSDGSNPAHSEKPENLCSPKTGLETRESE